MTALLSGPWPPPPRAGLDQLPTWVLEQKAAANHQVIATMRERLEREEPVQRMYGLLGLAWLQRQADIADQLIRARGQPSPWRPPLDRWSPAARSEAGGGRG